MKPKRKQIIADQKKEKSNGNNFHDPSVFLTAEQAPCGNDDADNRKRHISRWEKFEKLIKIAEFAAFIATIVGVGLLIRQLSLTQRQITEAKQAYQIDERAWVFIETANNDLILEGTNLYFVITARNAGKTQALVTGDTDIISDNFNDITNIETISTDLNLSLIPSGQTFLKREIPANYRTEMVKNTIYIFGTVFYSDIFGNPHWSQYCYSLMNNGINVQPMIIHSSNDDLEKIKAKKN